MEERYGKLTVVSWLGRRASCVCDCGKTTRLLYACDLKGGRVKSCGCLRADNMRRVQGHLATHLKTGTREFKSWDAMLQRCSNPKNASWALYGARGITVCKRWEKFENFLADMGERPQGSSLDRINNDDGYHPKNCRWATHKQQMRNRRTARLITWNSKTMGLSSWAEAMGLPEHTIRARLQAGWTVEKTLTAPFQPKRRNSQASSTARGVLFDHQTGTDKRPAINPLRNKRQPFAASRNSKGRAAKSSQAPKP